MEGWWSGHLPRKGTHGGLMERLLTKERHTWRVDGAVTYQGKAHMEGWWSGAFHNTFWNGLGWVLWLHPVLLLTCDASDPPPEKMKRFTKYTESISREDFELCFKIWDRANNLWINGEIWITLIYNTSFDFWQWQLS